MRAHPDSPQRKDKMSEGHGSKERIEERETGRGGGGGDTALSDLQNYGMHEVLGTITSLVLSARHPRSQR